MFYNKKEDELIKEFESSREGLKDIEARSRLKKYGFNEIKTKKRLNGLKIFLKQFTDPLVILLIVAVLISLLIENYIDGIIIGIILVLNAGLGFTQEFKAERSIELLKKLASPKSKVLRNNEIKIIKSRELVPGDVVVLESGDKVSADARIIEMSHFLVDESTLTGESVPIVKKIDVIDKEVVLADQKNMVFSGTLVTAGRALALVVSTGGKTELGRIAELVEKEDDGDTPLQIQLASFGKYLGVVIFAVVLLVLAVGIFRNLGFYEMFLTSLSLAISAIPEGLPAVITITLALGVKVMLKKNALIRRLKSVETLGSVTSICSDKTGTLTKNEMTVCELFVNNKIITVSGDGYKLEGNFYYNKRLIKPDPFKKLLEIGVSCNDASLNGVGEPTELALLISGAKAGIKSKLGRVDEEPFDSIKKYMVTVHEVNKKKLDYMKGAPERIIELCGYIEIDNKVRKLTDKDREIILNTNSNMAKRSLRVLAMAYRDNEKGIFVGLQGMRDPPRKEAKNAISMCKKAGIKVYMITGDNKNTALAIAKQVGIFGEAMEGKELGKLSLEEMQKVVREVNIFARVDPEHKVKILDALQKNGEVVGMTGDGVNDAPALKKADVGIAMSIKGTDIARDASDVILLDDNFNSIVSAVKEGRIIYDNIKKFIKFLLSVNFSEIFVVLLALSIKLPLPFLPLQILWLNLITDSLPALALSKEKGDPDIMEKLPRKKEEHILKGISDYIIIGGFLAFISMIIVFFYGLKGGNLEMTRTLVVTTSVFYQMFFVFSCRSDFSLKKIKFLSNKYLIGAVLLSILLHILVVYSPLSVFFGFTPLGFKEIGIALLGGITGFIFFEVKKFIKNR